MTWKCWPYVLELMELLTSGWSWQSHGTELPELLRHTLDGPIGTSGPLGGTTGTNGDHPGRNDRNGLGPTLLLCCVLGSDVMLCRAAVLMCCCAAVLCGPAVWLSYTCRHY